MEKILISAIKSGNNDVLLKIYKQYRNDFIRWAISNYRVSIEQAKLVYKEVVLNFYDHINEGKITELEYDIRTYLFQKGRYKSIRSFKKEDWADPGKDEARSFFNSSINKLSGTGRMVIQLFYINGLSLKEVTETMGFKDVPATKQKRFESFQQLTELIYRKQQHEKF